MNCDRCKRPLVGNVLMESSGDGGNTWSGCVSGEPAEQHVIRPGNVRHRHRHNVCPVTALSLVGKRYKSNAGDSLMVVGILPARPDDVQVQNITTLRSGSGSNVTSTVSAEAVARAIDARPDSGPLPWEKRKFRVEIQITPVPQTGGHASKEFVVEATDYDAAFKEASARCS